MRWRERERGGKGAKHDHVDREEKRERLEEKNGKRTGRERGR